MSAIPEYDPRYLAGILLFNRHEFFEAHEVWEDLWRDCAAEPRRFYQGLIQAAVAVYHGSNGNVPGARRLFESGRRYMSAYPTPYLGLDGTRFWQQMANAFSGFLDGTPSAPLTPLDPARVPDLHLDPPPLAWPDPSVILSNT